MAAVSDEATKRRSDEGEERHEGAKARRREEEGSRVWGLGSGRLVIGARVGCAVLILAIVASITGCKPRARIAGQPPTVASLVPSATDLLIGMGAGNHLVAVSMQDADRPEISKLPRVGDYRNLDWEQIAGIRPDVMIVFISPDRVPPALVQRTQEMGIKLVNIRTERLEDIFQTLPILGDAANEKQKAEAAATQLRLRLDAVKARVSNRPPIRTLVLRDAGLGVVGRETFIDDILSIAGGENVITAKGWPTLDAEQLRSCDAQVIVQLLPDASPQILEQAKHIWRTGSGIPAVKAGRVYVLTEWYAQQSGIHVGDLAETFAAILHPESPAATTRRAEGAR